MRDKHLNHEPLFSNLFYPLIKLILEQNVGVRGTNPWKFTLKFTVINSLIMFHFLKT